MQDVSGANATRNKIIETLKIRGPCLPVQIARAAGISPLFAGAFLSELAKDDHLRISNMKVGGSPLYYIKGQEALLENFYTYLPGKEREAFLILKTKRILEDRTQEPAIRVALRALRDFALAFKKDEEIMWRFHSVTEQEVRDMIEQFEKEAAKEKEIKEKEIKIKPVVIKLQKPVKELETQAIKEVEKIIKEEIKEKQPEKEKIFEKEKQLEKERVLDIGLAPVKEKVKKSGETFLEEVRSVLERKGISLSRLEGFDRKRVTAVVSINSKSYLLIAFNKKRINEKELIKAYKLAKQQNLPYYILMKEEPQKKMRETLEAYKNLYKIDNFL